MRSHQVEISALNIVVHPHDKKGKTYTALFKNALALEKKVRVHGHTWAMLGSCFEIVEGSPEKGLHGDIFRFTQIDKNSDWLNSKTKKSIPPSEAMKQVVLPDHLFPNVDRSRYVFFPLAHKLIFVSHSPKVSLSPSLAAKAFEGFLRDRAMEKKFGEVSVTVVQSKAALKRILSEIQLQELVIVVKQPNAGDGPDGDEATLERVLAGQNAREQAVILKSESKKFLKPNKNNTNLAKLATTNGHVRASGKDSNGNSVEEDTRNHPASKCYNFDGKQPLGDWLIQKAKDFLSKLL